MKKRVIVTGAGGFIGSHLVRFLKTMKYYVKGIDVRYPRFSKTVADEFVIGDLREVKTAQKEINGAHELYMLAADMGGIGYITENRSEIIKNNVLISVNSVEAAKENKISTIFFSSSACIYPQQIQKRRLIHGLKEADAIPANPDTFYGWEKLFTEKLLEAYEVDFGLKVRIARFHNIYGPEGEYEGGREKSPAAICRKIIKAKPGGEIEVWGNGRQTRSYCYIDDCIEGIYKLVKSDYSKPINIGSEEMISINELIKIISKIANKKVKKKYLLSKPQGVKSRNSDSSEAMKMLKWEVKTSLFDGIKNTFDWIAGQIKS